MGGSQSFHKSPLAMRSQPVEALQNGGLLDSVLACQEDSSDMSGCWTALFLATKVQDY